MIIITIYTVAYYLIVFNKYFEGINGQTLRNNTFIKQLLTYAMLITIFIASIMFFNMQNMVIDGFLTLDDKTRTTLIGAGAVDGIKMWGYRILGVIMIISVYIAIKAFKKNNTKRILKSLAVVPVYLVGLFIVMFGYNIIFKGNELEKQKNYIGVNIDSTKLAYDLKIDEQEITKTESITEGEVEENRDVINNIPIITEEIAKNNLLQRQTRSGYYTYNKAKAALYNGELSYVSARELDTRNEADQYTHGYGAVITSATETDEAGNIKYILTNFENPDITEPRIYYGVEKNKPIVVSEKLTEFDYPKTNTNNETYTYKGNRRNFIKSSR